jgi:hypothetical protein
VPCKREFIQNKLRELGFKFHEEAKHTFAWRKGEAFVYMRKREFLDDDWVRATLQKQGMTKEETEKFIGSCNS